MEPNDSPSSGARRQQIWRERHAFEYEQRRWSSRTADKLAPLLHLFAPNLGPKRLYRSLREDLLEVFPHVIARGDIGIFHNRIWPIDFHAFVLLSGPVLSPGERDIECALEVPGPALNLALCRVKACEQYIKLAMQHTETRISELSDVDVKDTSTWDVSGVADIIRHTTGEGWDSDAVWWIFGLPSTARMFDGWDELYYARIQRLPACCLRVPAGDYRPEQASRRLIPAVLWGKRLADGTAKIS